MRLPDDGAGLDVKGREQRGGPVPPVVVGPSFGLTRLHRQQRRRAVEGLNLRFLVEAQHHGMVGGIHIQPDDVPHLVDKQRVGRQLERLAAVGAQPEGAPDAADGHATQPRLTGERTRAPVRGAGRSRLQGSDYDLLHLFIVDGAWRTRSRLIQKAMEPVARKARAPFAYRRRRQVKTPGDGLVVLARRAAEHDASPPCELRGGPRPASQRLEVLVFVLGENNGGLPQNLWAEWRTGRSSSDPQRARVLTAVKARRSAPPPLRGAHGLDAGSAHAHPGSCLTMTHPEAGIGADDPVPKDRNASRSGIRDNWCCSSQATRKGERDADQEYLESAAEALGVRLRDRAARRAPAPDPGGPRASPRRDPRDVLALPAPGPRATTRCRRGASTSCPCGTSPWSSSTRCAACPARAAASRSRPSRGPPASTD